MIRVILKRGRHSDVVYNHKSRSYALQRANALKGMYEASLEETCDGDIIVNASQWFTEHPHER